MAECVDERISMRLKAQAVLTIGGHGFAKRARIIVAQGAMLVSGGCRKILKVAIEVVGSGGDDIAGGCFRLGSSQGCFRGDQEGLRRRGDRSQCLECLAISSTDRGSKSTIIS